MEGPIPKWFLVEHGYAEAFGYNQVHRPLARSDVVDMFTTRQRAIEHASERLHPAGIEPGAISEPAALAKLLEVFAKPWNGVAFVSVDPGPGEEKLVPIGDVIRALLAEGGS